MIERIKALCWLLVACSGLLVVNSAFAVPLNISITNPPAAVTATAVGDTQFWPRAGTLGPGGIPISLRATVQNISAGDSITLFTSGDDPVVRANTGSLSAVVLWEVFNRATGQPIVGDPDFLITDIDGRNGNPIESVSAACAGLTSYTTNGNFLAGCNANNNGACASNIRVTESGGSILAEGTQNQNGGQQEGYMQYSWTGVSSWTVSYFSTSGGRWYVHDADGDIPFDMGTRVDVDLVDLATIKGLAPGSLTSPAQNEQITFQIDLSNLGPAAATGANLADVLPAGLMYLSHTTTAGNYNPVSGVWDNVNVAVMGVETLTITALVTAPANTPITNVTTTALSQESVCSSRDLLDYTFVVAETPAPALSVVKSIDPATSFNAAGDTITYRYLVTNTGNVNIDNVVPVDVGPMFGTQPASNSLSVFDPASATIIPGGSQVFTATYLLDQLDVDNMAMDANPLMGIDNSATATGDPTGGMLAPVTPSTVETGFAPTPSMSISKSVSAATTFSQAGDTITYQYEITNTGNITIDSVLPTDVGPTFNGISGVNSLSPFMPMPASLAPTASETFTATYLLDQIDVDNMAAAGIPTTAIDNSASAIGDPVGVTALPPVTPSLVETGFAPAPGLSIAKTVSTATAFSQAGDTITYQFLVTNTGNVTVNNVVPVDIGPTFNSAAATNSLSAFSPSSASLAPMASEVFTATYVLDQADVDSVFAATTPVTAIDNSASVQGVPTGGVLPAIPPSMAETGFVANASLALSKTAGVPSVGLGANSSATDAGDTIAYSFEVSNDGAVTVSNLAINDLGVMFNSVAGTGTLSAISCPLSVLAPSQITTCTALYTLSQLDVDNAVAGGANSVVNTANASGQDPANGPVVSSNEMATTSIVADSSISLTKSAAAPTVALGNDATIVDPDDTIAFTVTIENTGNTSLSSVVLSDSITTLVCPATTSLGNAFANDGNDVLVAGDSVSCSATYVLLQTNLNSGSVINTASVNSLDPTGAMITDMDAVTSGFTQKASISLVKTGTNLPPNPVVGNLITYSFELSNTGNVSLSSPQVSDSLCQAPVSPLTFASGYQSGDALVAGELDVGETWLFECQYAITQPDINAGEVSNTATGTGMPPAGSGLAIPTSTASNLADAQQNAAISLIKTASLPTVVNGSVPTASDVGDTVSYTFEVENTGNVTLTNVVVIDPLITTAPNNGTISCPSGVASMSPQEIIVCTATYTLILADIDTGQVANTANVTGTPPVSIPPINAPQAQSSSVVTISPAPELTVNKSVQALPNPFAESSVINYSYEVVNSGNVTITAVSPVDLGPSFNGNAGTNSLSAFNPTPADLGPGESQVFNASYTVSQIDLDNLAAAANPLTAVDNEATAQGTPARGNLPPVDPSMVETGVQLSAELELIKTSVAPSPAFVGSDIVYTFALQNTGVLSIDNPIVTDSQCADPGTILSFTNGFVSGDTGTIAQVLDPGETWTFSCTYPISQVDIDVGTVQNSALGSGQDPSGSTVDDVSDSGNPGDTGTADDDPSNTPLVRTPSWTVAKSTASVPTMMGDTLVYQFVVDNTGNVSVSNIVVTDAKCAATPNLIAGDTNADMILDPAEIWTYECTSQAVSQGEVDAATVNNSVSVTGLPPTGSPTLPPAVATVMTPIIAAPTLSILKSADPATTGLGSLATATDAGDTISYAFEVENTGNVSLSSIVVNDTGPTFGVPATVGAGSWSGVSCPVTSLLPQQVTTCTATYTLAQSDIDLAITAGPNSIVNSATADGMPPLGPLVSSPPSVATQSITADPGLEILKTAGTPTVNLGTDPTLTDPDDTVAFVITVENTGNAELSNVVVSDNLTAVSCDTTAAPSGNAFSNNGSGSLAVGDTISCQASYILDQDDINIGEVINTGSVTSEDPTGIPVNGVAEATTTFTQKTSVALQKTSNTLPPMPVANVSTLTYDFLLENTGNVSLTDAEISDVSCQMPAGPLSFSNGFVSGDDDANGILDAGEVWLFQCDYVVTQTDLNLGEIINVATGTGTPPVGSGLGAPNATSSNLAEAEQFTGITLDKVAGVATQTNGINSQVGDTVTFTFNIENTGNVSLTDIDLSDPLITGAPNNAVLTCIRDDGLMTAFDPLADSLNPNEKLICSGDYSLQQSDIDAGLVSNMATVEAAPPVSVPPINNPIAMSGSMTPIPADPMMSIDKSASAIPSTVAAGSMITYSYTVENTGNVSMSMVSPIDLGPTFNGIAGTNTLSVFSPAPVDLGPGETELFTATYEISQADLDNMAASASPTTAIANEASAEGEPANGPIPIVPPDMVMVGVAPAPMLELMKSSTVPGSVSAGSQITYDFVLANTGNVTISNPLINDAKCNTPAAPLSFTNGFQSGDTGVILGSLDVGETWSYSCQYTITQADLDAGTVQNTATAVGQDPAGNDVMDVSDSTNPGDDSGANNDPTNSALPRTPSWMVTKSTTSVPMVMGDTLVYRFVVDNTGNVSISNVMVSDAKCAAIPVLIAGDVNTDMVLDPTEIWTYECTSQGVLQSEVDLAAVNNSVSVTGMPPLGSPTLPPAVDSVTTPIAATPALRVVKSADPATTGLGDLASATDADDTIAYTFEVENTGNVSLTSIAVNDVGPSFGVPATTGAGTWTGVTCPVTDLLPAQTTTCTGTYTLAQQDIDLAIAAGPDSVVNSATAEGTPPIGGAVISPPSVATQSIMADPSLEILKTAGVATTNLGNDQNITDPDDTVLFTITVENTGNTRLDNVMVSDDLTSVICDAAATPSGDLFTNGTGSLAVGDTISCEANYVIDQDDINLGQVVNTGSVTSQDPSGTPVNGMVQATSGFTQKTSVTLQKTSSMLPPQPVAGVSTLTYFFRLENTGNVSLTDALVSDLQCQIPIAPLTFTNGYVSGDDNNGILDAGEIWLFQCDYVVTQDDINDGEISNVATATGTPPGNSGLSAPQATSSNLAEAGQFTGIALDKVAGLPTQTNGTNSQVGDTVTFTFNIENTGNVTLSDIDLSDPFITGAPNNGSISCIRDDGLMTPFDPIADTLNPTDSLICSGDYSLQQGDIDAGSVANVATIEADPPMSVPQIDRPMATSASMAPVAADPRMSIDKSASAVPSTVTAGSVITYTYDVVNTGNVSLSAVVPVDLGPTFYGVAGTNALSGFSPAPVDLAPNGMQSFTATYVISQVDLDNMAASGTPDMAIVNEATADGVPANGPAPVVTPSTAVVGVAPQPMLQLTKSSTVPNTISAGSLITYNFSLLNTGNVTISNPLINDVRCNIPAAPLSFTSGFQGGDSGVMVGSLDVGETWTYSCQYALTQADLDAGTVQNTATAIGQDPAGNDVMDVSDTSNPGDGSAAGDDPTNSPLQRTSSWTVDKSTNSVPLAIGDTLVYQFLITNTGNVSISGVSVTDGQCQTLPSLDPASDLATPGVISPAGQGGSPAAEQWLYTCTSVAIDQTDLDAARIDNTVSISGTAPGGNPPDMSDSISTQITTTPAMSLVKSAGASSLNADGSFDQLFNFVLKNTGNVTLNSVSIADDLQSQFGACFDSVLSVGTTNLIPPATNSTIPSSGTPPIIATNATLAVGDSMTVDNYSVRFNPNASGCAVMPTENTATATASTTAAGNISDVSDNGIDPDAGNPNDAGDPTPFVIPVYMPQLGSSKSAGIPTLNADGTIDVEYTILIQNTGDVDIQNLSITDDLSAQFGPAFTSSDASNQGSGILVAPAVSEVFDANADNLVLPTTSAAFDGTAATNMFDGVSGYLGVGDRIQITFTTRINPSAPGAPAQLFNTATVMGTDPAGAPVVDDTDSGSDPTTNPGGAGSPTPVVPPLSMPVLQLIKTGVANSNGTIDYEFTITNTGSVNIMDITLSDPLLSDFTFSNAIDADNDSDIDILDPGASATVTASYALTASDFAAGMVQNTATAMGVDSTGMQVEDDSDSGNPGDDTGAGDDPTVTSFDPPSLGVAKALVAGSPVDLGNGNYQVSYEFVIENTGPFDLTGVQLVDDLNLMINTPNVNRGTFSNPVVTSPNRTLTPNASFNGSSNTNLLSGNDSLLVGEVGLVALSFVFDPDVYFGPFFNQASVSANDSNGDTVEDLSEQGAAVNPGVDSVTPFSLSTPSTPITLGWFKAQSQGGSLMFEWATEVEISNAGFYLLVEDNAGTWQRINQEMIVATGDSTHVQFYQYTAAGVSGRRFKLVDVSVTGKLVEHGPFDLNAEFGTRVPRKATNWDEFKSESDLKRQRRQQDLRERLQKRIQQMKSETSNVDKLEQKKSSFWSHLAGAFISLLVPTAQAIDLVSFKVEEAGIYKVTHAELLSHGVDLRGVSAARIGIEQANEPWPVKVYPLGTAVFTSSSSVVFPGQGQVTLYSGENKYTLVLDESTPSIIEEDNSTVPPNTAPAHSYLAEKTYAPQNRYTHLSPNQDDSWYADRLFAINGAVSKQVSLLVDDYAPAFNTPSFGANSIARMPTLRPRLEVNLWGSSNLPGNGLTAPDHHVLIDFNGQRVADESFDGLHEYPISTVLTNLEFGQNTIKLTLPKDHGYQFDIVNLDRISIRYPRLFKAQGAGKGLSFASAWNFFKVSELASNDVTIIRVDQARQGHLMTARVSGQCTQGCVYFAGSSNDQNDSYYLATNNGFKTPEIELVNGYSDLFSGQANYLIIAHPDFIATNSSALETYANELNAEYGSVDIVNVERIYGEYSGYVVNADAIYSYVQDAYQERGTRHVLLVGGDIYDYHNNLNSDAKSFIPSLYVQVAQNLNAVPSDAKYADVVDDDGVPDITISRLPVRSSAELEMVLAKRQDYLARSFDDKAIFAADIIDASGYSFKADSELNIARYFSDWEVDEIYVDDISIGAGKQQLVAGINSGASLTSYFGHSSTDRWSISGLLTGNDVAALTNFDSPTVVAQWGCWNTFYVSPDQDSLAHRFLVDGQHGAVTVMGATSFTKADAERRMADLLYARLNQGMKIGDAVLSAKRALAENYPYQLDVLLGWAVLGPDDFPIIRE